VTLDGGETGNITLRLQPATACSFRRAKLEIGAQATPWSAPSLDMEELRCRRYFQRLAVTGATPAVVGHLGQRVGANAIDAICTPSLPMRSAPSIVTSGFAWVNAPPAGNQVGFYSNSSAIWSVLSGALTVTTLGPASPSCVVLRLQAGTSFTGAAGGIGNIHLGSQAFIALQAEL
jgi:hypothetical protein